MLPIVVTSLAGLLMALPTLDQRTFALMWIGMTMMITVLINKPAYLAFRYSLLSGVVFTATVFHWMPGVGSDSLGISIIGGTMLASVSLVWDAFRFAMLGFLVGVIRPRGWYACLVWPIVWTALEAVWPHLFPWRVAHTQLGWLAFVQGVELVGTPGVGFLVVWTSTAFAYSLHALHHSLYPSSARVDRSHGRASLVGITLGHVVVTVLLVVASALWGTHRIDQIERIADESPHLKVALIQPGANRAKMRQSLQSQSRAVSDQVDLVVWPESSIGGFSKDLHSFRLEAEVRAMVKRSTETDPRPCPDLGCHLLCDGPSFPGLSNVEGPFHNTAYLVDAYETIIGRYDKRVLMPWGEYVVGQQYIPMLGELLGHGEYISGDSAHSLVMPSGERLGVLICYEDLLEQPVRETCLAGTDVLLNLNNLTIFNGSAGMWQHQQIATFRAIENRRYLLRCGITGPTTVISAVGTVEQQAALDIPATLVAAVPLIHLQTFAARYGATINWICPLLALTLLAAQLLVPPRRTSQSSTDQEHQRQQTG